MNIRSSVQQPSQPPIHQQGVLQTDMMKRGIATMNDSLEVKIPPSVQQSSPPLIPQQAVLQTDMMKRGISMMKYNAL